MLQILAAFEEPQQLPVFTALDVDIGTGVDRATDLQLAGVGGVAHSTAVKNCAYSRLAGAIRPASRLTRPAPNSR